MNYCYITKLALIVSDEKPNYLDFYITTVKDSNGIRFTKGQRLDKDNSDYSDCKKIIAELPSINYSKLSLEEQNRLGWIDVEGLAREEIEGETFANIHERQRHINRFKAGLQHQLSTKRYSEEDMERMFNIGVNAQHENKDNSIDFLNKKLNDAFKSLDQPKLIPIEIKIESNKITIGNYI